MKYREKEEWRMSGYWLEKLIDFFLVLISDFYTFKTFFYWINSNSTF